MPKLAAWIIADLLLLALVLAAMGWGLGLTGTDLLWTAAIWIGISVVWFGAEIFTTDRSDR